MKQRRQRIVKLFRVGRCSGFSLVEVTLAVAIAAMGIITVLGMIPLGMKNVRDAGLTVTSSRIFQQMVGEVQTMDWGTYSAGYPGWSRLVSIDGAAGGPAAKRYFDNEGTRIKVSDNGFSTRLSYVAEFHFPERPVVMTGVTASASSGDLRPDMRHLEVRLIATSNPSYNFAEDGPHLQRMFIVTRPY